MDNFSLLSFGTIILDPVIHHIILGIDVDSTISNFNKMSKMSTGISLEEVLLY